MTGKINSENGYVKVEIHKVFKILLSIFLCFPIISIIIMIISKSQNFSLFMILIMIGQILMIRYVFINLAFRLLSKVNLK